MKRGTVMPRPNVKVVGIPLKTDVEITAPRYTRGDYHVAFLFSCDKSFRRFSHTRRRHNASLIDKSRECVRCSPTAVETFYV